MGVLSFRVGPVPVRVQASFFLTALLLGWQPGPHGLERLFLWSVVVFFGVLAHEMGHAAAALAFGYRPRIELYLFGGVTWWEAEAGASTARTVLVTLAGPATGIVLGGLAWLGALHWAAPLPPGSAGAFLLERFVWVNLGWGLLNLLPILPLDGGVVFAASVEHLLPGRGRMAARLVSLGLALLLVWFALTAGMTFGAAMAGWLAFDNARSGWAEWQLRRDEACAGIIEQAIGALGRGDADALVEAADALRRTAHSLPLRRFGEWLDAWGALLQGRRRDVEAWLAAHRTADVRASALISGALALLDGKAPAALELLSAGLGETISPLDLAALRAAFLASGRFDVAVALVDSPAGRRLSVAQVGELAAAAAEAGFREAAERLQELAAAASSG